MAGGDGDHLAAGIEGREHDRPRSARRRRSAPGPRAGLVVALEAQVVGDHLARRRPSGGRGRARERTAAGSGPRRRRSRVFSSRPTTTTSGFGAWSPRIARRASTVASSARSSAPRAPSAAGTPTASTATTASSARRMRRLPGPHSGGPGQGSSSVMSPLIEAGSGGLVDQRDRGERGLVVAVLLQVLEALLARCRPSPCGSRPRGSRGRPGRTRRESPAESPLKLVRMIAPTQSWSSVHVARIATTRSRVPPTFWSGISTGLHSLRGSCTRRTRPPAGRTCGSRAASCLASAARATRRPPPAPAESAGPGSPRPVPTLACSAARARARLMTTSRSGIKSRVPHFADLARLHARP